MSKALIAALAFFIGLVNATNWAVIISGSEEMYNYRHHADVGHAFDLLTAGKIAPENIITMVYNDVPTHRSNPRSGEMFNKPSSDYDGNVWTQVLDHVDYAGEDVNVENFINVLLGNSADGRKVLKSTEDDNVFIFYSDHGTDGLLSMPGSNSPLLVDDLRKTLLNMSFSKKFKNLVFYLEACYSGSMFQGWLEHDTPHNIWAVTAANARESSWGWYCPPNSSVGSTKFNTCLGDEFSVAWMESVDEGSDTMTLRQHFEYLRGRVSKSNVTLYGNPKMANLKVSDFVNAPGAVRKPKISFDDAMLKHQMVTVEEMNHKIQDALAIDSRDMKLAYHYSQYTAAKEGTFQEKYDSGIRLINEIKQRLADDAFFSKLASDYFGPSNASSVLLSSPVEASAYECGSCCTDAYKAFYSGSCKGFNDYSLKYGHIFKSICMDKSLRTRNLNVENLSAHLSSNIEKTCSMPPVQF